MRIENLYQEQVVNQYNQNSRTTDQETEKKSKTSGKDVFEMSEEIPVMPSETYNDFAQIVKSQSSSETGAEEETEEEAEDSMQMSGMPPMPPMPPMEEMETEEVDETASETVNDTVNSVISGISEALSVSESDVFEALKSLQLSPSELLSEEGLASVVNALTSGNTTTETAETATVASASAETTEEEEESTDTTDTDISATMASLKELMESAVESLQEKLGMTDEEFEEFLNSSDDFDNGVAEYATGNIRNMGNAYDMQQFVNMMQNQGNGIA